MTLDPAFLALMPDMVSIKLATTRNNYGEEGHGTAVSYRAHVTYMTRRTFTRDGEPTTITAKAIIAGVVSGITSEALVTLPDGTERRVVGVTLYHDQTGPNHHTLSLQ